MSAHKTSREIWSRNFLIMKNQSILLKQIRVTMLDSTWIHHVIQNHSPQCSRMIGLTLEMQQPRVERPSLQTPALGKSLLHTFSDCRFCLSNPYTFLSLKTMSDTENLVLIVSFQIQFLRFLLLCVFFHRPALSPSFILLSFPSHV